MEKNADHRKTSQIMRFRFLQTPSSLCSFLQKIFLAFFFDLAFVRSVVFFYFTRFYRLQIN